MMSLLITSYPQTEIELKNGDFELNLYPAQEEGLLYCQILHPETELQDVSQKEDCL